MAIVDAYNDPNAESDLKAYREHYKLAECTEKSGCFKKVNQAGETEKEAKSFPVANAGWSEEISLDLDMVSAVCPECHILLVEATNNEANSEGLQNLYLAENEAATLKATVISNSWGAIEFSGETSDDKYFTHENASHERIPIAAAAGDTGYGVSYPAASKDVISVGGTTLYKTPFYERGWFEETWWDTGSGCSAYELKESWQTEGCGEKGEKRTDNDVAAVASPETPVSVYDSYDESGWLLVGGTSVATPIIASVEELSSSAVRAEGAATFYKHAASLFDVTTGDNWAGEDEACSPEYLCTARAGYDGPTGNGTPDLEGGGAGQPGKWSSVSMSGPISRGHSVSCTSSTACVAVGSNGKYAAFQSWNGTEWSSLGIGVPRPSGGSEVTLASVSCTASSACVAVGHYINSSGTEVTLAESWNGTAWSIVSTPSPGTRASSLGGVSCTSSTACTAVGSSTNSLGEKMTLAEAWNGIGWSVQTTPNPTGKAPSLEGVSCTSSTACTAVGIYGLSGEEKTRALVESWNGTAWSIQSTPLPAEAEDTILQNVSCTSASACTAVGWYTTPKNEVLMERWNGTAWELQTVAKPLKTSIETNLDNVSCTSSTSCEAVGNIDTTAFTNYSEPFAEHWNGTAWSDQEPPATNSSVNILAGVSCTSSTACVAVGYFYAPGYFPYGGLEADLGFNLSGTTWSAKSMLSASSSAAVSCASAVACTAVGSSPGENDEGTSEQWNGAAWSNASAVSPSGSAGFSLSGISCTSPGECTAVGSYANSSATQLSLAEHSVKSKVGRGPVWSVQSTANPSGAKATYLAGVACTASSACTAVGRYINSSSVELTLAEYWNGTEWTIQETKTPTGAKSSSLVGVSCTSSAACTAIGHYVNSSGVEVTLGERWNGKEWSIESTLNPTGAKASSLAGVSCTSSSACTAVGHYTNSSSAEVTLAERWNGTAWTVQTTPTPTGAKASSLKAVSCASASACTAVGSYTTSSTTGTLVEFWTGSEWLVQSTPNPGGATASTLQGVSCTSSPLCIATGTTTGKDSQVANLSEVLWGPVPPPRVTTEPATGITETGATLNGVVNPNGAETKYYFEYGTTESYGSKTAEVIVGSGEGNLEESKAITGLAVDKQYDFRIVATNSSNETSRGANQVFTTYPYWTIQTTPSPGNEFNELHGVSCASSTLCIAVGYDNYEPLAESWNGTEWSPQSIPSAPKYTELNSVSCPSSTACFAVGSGETARVAVAERWNGSAWSLQTIPHPKAEFSELKGISCTSATACTAVGVYGYEESMFAERWNGTEWTLETITKPTGSKVPMLTGVSCSSSTSCTAVGRYENSSDFIGNLVEHWNGTEWAQQTSPSPAGAEGDRLLGVSCQSSTACTAVGWYLSSGSKALTLAETWNGTEWKVQTTQNPEAKSDELVAVSCTSSTFCLGVGLTITATAERLPLGEEWNGSEWKLQTPPNPPRNPVGSEAWLRGISCVSSTECETVGDYVNTSTKHVTLAEMYH